MSPFVGAGVNYTMFFSEDTGGALQGSTLKLGTPGGRRRMRAWISPWPAISALRVDVRWIDIDSRVKLDWQKIGTVNIDPLVYGLAYVQRF